MNLSNKEELDTIVHLLQNPDKIDSASPVLARKMEQISYADDMIRRYTRLKEAVRQIQTKFSVSKTKAYELCREAQYVHGSMPMYVKEYWRNILIEKALKMLERCDTNNQVKEFNLTMKNLILLFGFTLDDQNKVNAEMLSQHSFTLNVTFKDGSENYTLDMAKLHRMALPERLKLIQAIDAEYIEFDMVKKIDEENAE